MTTAALTALSAALLLGVIGLSIWALARGLRRIADALNADAACDADWTLAAAERSGK